MKSAKMLMFAVAIIATAAYAQSAEGGLEDILKRLGSADLKVRNQASRDSRAHAKIWLQLPAEEMRQALPVIIEAATRNTDPGVRVQASALLSALAIVRPNDTLTVIDGFLDSVLTGFADTEPRARANFVRCLATAKPAPPAEAIPAFEALLQGEPSEARTMAVVGLVRASPGALSTVDAISDLLNRSAQADKPDIVRAVGAAQPTHPLLIAELTELLASDDPELLRTTVSVLGSLGVSAVGASEELRTLSQDPDIDEEIRRQAAIALEYVEGRRARQ